MKKFFFSKTFDEDERTNCRDDFFIQYWNIAADKWRKEKKEKEYDECWWKISENKYKKIYEKEIREKKRELSIYDVRRSCREEFKCTNFSEILH